MRVIVKLFPSHLLAFICVLWITMIGLASTSTHHSSVAICLSDFDLRAEVLDNYLVVSAHNDGMEGAVTL